MNKIVPVHAIKCTTRYALNALIDTHYDVSSTRPALNRNSKNDRPKTG